MHALLVPLPPDHPFAGIAIKLQRADENIVNLENEILRFFQECKYPVMPTPDDKRWQEALDYHTKELPIPKRFSVLAGEIVHHWRSCLDHIVWIFSDPAYREAHMVQFPILRDPPDAKMAKRFEEQIGGVPNPSKARQVIRDLQPYHVGADAIDHPLCIIHDMDRFDKHRELVIVHSLANVVLPADTPPDVVAAAVAYGEGKPTTATQRKSVYRALKDKGRVLPQVAFAKFGRREDQFVSSSLRALAVAMEQTVAKFLVAL